MTREDFAESALQVRKGDGRLVPFNRDRLRRSVERALVRSYPSEKLDGLVARIVSTGSAEAVNGVVDSAAIGAAALTELKALDPASHIRFALVHVGRLDRARGGGWTDVAQVRRWLHEQYPDLPHRPSPGQITTVVKRNGEREKFDRTKLERSIGRAAKGREAPDALRRRSAEVADMVERILFDQPVVTSGQIAAEILRVFRRWDHIAFLRFASTAKGFRSPEDFETEARPLMNREQRPPGAAPAPPG
ncbi:MAG: ATP cone domain-containing protein [Thermoleophilia bacterium]